MAILTSGAGSLKLSVPKGSSLIIRNLSGTETVTGSGSAREDATAFLGAGAYVYGPQAAEVQVTISTTGTLDYSVVAGDPTPATPDVYVTRNPATGAPTGIVDGTGTTVAAGGGGTSALLADLSRTGLSVDTGAATVATGPSTTEQQATELAALSTALPKSIDYRGSDQQTLVGQTMTMVGRFIGWANASAGVACNAYLSYSGGDPVAFFADGFCEAIFDSDDFALVFSRPGATVGAPAAQTWIKVDGKLVSANWTNTPNVTVAQTAVSWVRITRSSRRPVRVTWGANCWLREIRLKNYWDTVKPLNGASRLLGFGDSFDGNFQNSGETVLVPYSAALGAASAHTQSRNLITTYPYMSNVLGLDTPVVSAYAGTGFFSTNTANGRTYLSYLDRADNIPVLPDVVAIHLKASGNDLSSAAPGTFVSGKTAAEYQARVEATVESCKRIAPNAIIAISEIPRTDAFEARWTPSYIAPVTDLLKAACLRTGAKFLPAGPSAPDGYGMFTGNGRYNAKNNSGNSDLYIGWTGSDNHPNSNATAYMGAFLADLMAAAK